MLRQYRQLYSQNIINYTVETCQILALLDRGRRVDRTQELSCLYIVNEPEDFMEYDFVCPSCVVESWPINTGQKSRHFFAASSSTRCLNICVCLNKVVYKIPPHI